MDLKVHKNIYVFNYYHIVSNLIKHLPTYHLI